MNAGKKALLLVGSPKISGSSSESLGVYLLNRLEEKGFATEKLHINRSLKTPSGHEDLLEAVNSCDILILAFPLYADSLPSGVINTLEMLAKDRAEKLVGQGAETSKNQVMIALCNSGFPEAHQSDTALAICRCFAKEAGFTWAGGLPLGGGGAINGQPLEKLGRMMQSVRNALDLVAEALAEGMSIPEKTEALMRKPLIPRWIYLLIGNMAWKMQARKNGVAQKINDRPYEKN